MNRLLIILILFCFIPGFISGQKVSYDFSKRAVTERIKTDIYTLSSDSFMGREAGTAGEILARDYIIAQFKGSDLLPYFGDTSYVQSFDINETLTLGKHNYFGIDKSWQRLYLDYSPVVYSSNDTVFGKMCYVKYGIIVPSAQYDDYTDKTDLIGKIFVIELSIPGGYHVNSEFYNYMSMSYKIELAIKKGAKGIIFINSDKNYPYEPVNLVSGFKQYPIPVIYFKGKLEVLFPDDDNTREAYIITEIKRNNSGKAQNVAGYIDNRAPYTVIIGAHYDHLGFGGVGSLSRGSKEIHNGADDNASGTAAVIELGRYLKNSGIKNYNYLLVGFSGEELGLLGSKHFVKNNEFNKAQINYMINIDMIGRLDTASRRLEVWAAGSSKQWKSTIEKQSGNTFNFKVIKGSVGNSDHFAFYKKQIPSLFFITGVHSDYHKPSDKADLINFAGEVEIIVYLEQVITALELQDKLKYKKVGVFSNIGAIFYTIDEIINYSKQ